MGGLRTTERRHHAAILTCPNDYLGLSHTPIFSLTTKASDGHPAILPHTDLPSTTTHPMHPARSAADDSGPSPPAANPHWSTHLRNGEGISTE